MYGKIINEKLVIALNRIKTDTCEITNPKHQDYISNGYKEIFFEDLPKYDFETEKIVESYTEKESSITVSYSVINLSDIEYNKRIFDKIDEEFAKITIEDLINLYDGKKETSDKINEIKNNVAKLKEKLRGK